MRETQRIFIGYVSIWDDVKCPTNCWLGGRRFLIWFSALLLIYFGPKRLSATWTCKISWSHSWTAQANFQEKTLFGQGGGLIYIYINIYIYMYVNYVNWYLCTNIKMYIYTWKLYLKMSISKTLYYLYSLLYLSPQIYISKYLNIHIHIHIHIYLYIYIHIMYIYLSLYIYIHYAPRPPSLALYSACFAQAKVPSVVNRLIQLCTSACLWSWKMSHQAPSSPLLHASQPGCFEHILCSADTREGRARELNSSEFLQCLVNIASSRGDVLPPSFCKELLKAKPFTMGTGCPSSAQRVGHVVKLG